MNTTQSPDRYQWNRARRCCLLGPMGATAMLSVSGWVRAQSRAPLPALGSVLPLAPVSLLGGGHFDPAGAHFVLCKVLRYKNSGTRSAPLACKSWPGRPTGNRKTPCPVCKKSGTLPSAWLPPALALALHYPKPKGLPVTAVRGRGGRVVPAESGQLFPEDVAELARWMWGRIRVTPIQAAATSRSAPCGRI